MTTPDRFIPFINDFATRSLRDVADQDYICARAAHRAGLTQPFLWSALQAAEKYLKAILVFNDASAKGLQHDLDKALRRVEAIPDLQFTVHKNVRDFLGYLNRYGRDRYLTQPTVLRHDSLLLLDKTTWQLRRFCFYMRGRFQKDDGTTVDWLPLELARVLSADCEAHPERFRLGGGYLEKVISAHGPAYESLVWKNFFYGRRHKRRIKNFHMRTGSSNPTHSLHPEVFPALEALVDFPKNVAAHYHSLASSNPPGVKGKP